MREHGTSGRRVGLSIPKGATLANPGTASLGKIARGGAAAFPTVIDAPTQVNPVSAATIERLTGVKLPTSALKDFEGYHSRS
jgi:hypothetical protein